ncbi:3-carboxy-cis,cis-muconate cycloisomerase [Arvimicrobium flavum]|uniref:3-carboxy-cis,cis-muconate cycloisomerase n=1 Tax=Arvimicrobium flavum TaxID=3393320 RepID=UPI00237BA4A3|nr:3-carboxy-cis,cis-muconate cycloisomerase [Mesorhizobium shangrilense]
MTFSAFDHLLLGGLLGDEEIAGYFAAEAEISSMLAFEVALAEAEAACGIIPKSAAEAISAAAAAFSPDMDAMRRATSVDGVTVPEFVRQLRRAVGGEAAQHVHFGATSQDVIDTGLMLRLVPVLNILRNRLSILLAVLQQVETRFGANVLTGHTRMQPAIPISAADRIRAWREPLVDEAERLAAWIADRAAIQFGGAAGTLEKLGDKAAAVRAGLAERLGLADAPQWHSQRARLVDLANVLSMITGGLGKFGQDVALLAQGGSEIALAGGGGSSAMPHKQNPVAAETLAALARFNATQSSAMHHALVHEQERSGAAWMLEWMVLPQMVCATAAALRHGVELAGSIRRLGKSDDA